MFPRGCRNDGEGAGNDGLVLWSPYPKLGLTGTFTSPYGKGWSAQMAGHSRTLSTTLPQRPTRPWGLTPASPYPKLGLIYLHHPEREVSMAAGTDALLFPVEAVAAGAVVQEFPKVCPSDGGLGKVGSHHQPPIKPA